MLPDVTFTDVSRAEAIDDARAGFVMDEDTFRAFYDRTARGVWAYLARMTGDRQLADDLLQETFIAFCARPRPMRVKRIAAIPSIESRRTWRGMRGGGA
jgi:hypothetical protein